MSAFTCLTCHVAFNDSEVQRDHYKADWHRYNLKRKVADLPPVTAESFVTLVKQRSQAEGGRGGGATGHDSDDASTRQCTYCRKNFGTVNAYENHANSKKHAEAVERYDEKVRSVTELKNAKNAALSGFKLTSQEQQSSKKKQPSSAGFASGHSADKKPVATTAAGPAVAGATSKFVRNEDDDEDDDDLSFDSDEEMDEWDDVEGEPLGLEECLFCSFLSQSLEDNMKHMTVEHSFFVPDIEYLVDLEGLVAYLAEKVGVGNVCLWCSDKSRNFYTVKAVQQHMNDKGHCMMLYEGATLEEYADFYDYSSSYPDAGEAGADGQVALDAADLQQLDGGGYEMVLPSGAVIGHRSLMKYYKQHLRPVRATPNKKLLTNVMSHYRGLGWTGTTGAAAIERARSITIMHMRRSKQYMRQGIVNNKVLQKHFRHQNPL